jgi:hypothetical protein
MKHAFPWFVVHRQTRYIVAGFVDFDDADKFCAAAKHGMYIVAAGVDLESPLREQICTPMSVGQSAKLI